jgi:hypothetical protein
MTVRLAADDGTWLELDDCDTGYVVEQVEVGAPETRAVVDPRTMVDGVIDRTRLVGARVISVNLRLVEGPAVRLALLDALAPFLHPARRSWLTIGLDPATPRMYRVRADDWSAPWERPTDVALSLSWRTASDTPFALSPTLREVVLVPGGAEGRNYLEAEITEGVFAGTTGRVYDRTYPFSGATVAPVRNLGNAPAHFTATVYGPIDGFTLRNITADAQLAFADLTIPAGQNVVIDSAAHTVLANGEPGSSRYSYLDFATSAWFTLLPGVNQMTVDSDTFSAPSQTVLRWHDAYLI